VVGGDADTSSLLPPNAHFRKAWQYFVKLWLDQPSKKLKRRQTREKKAKRVAPRPLDKLRPVVRSMTNKYNMKIRGGRGFTFDELKGAGIRRKEAAGVGITTDHRRKNRSSESYDMNVARLKAYKARLVIFPRNPTSKNDKKGDSKKADLEKSVQVTERGVVPVGEVVVRTKARKITAEEKKANVSAVLRKARTDAKLWGIREKREKDKREGKSKKDKAKTDEPMEE